MSTKRRQSPAKRADRDDDALPIRFEATVEALGDRTILRLPDAASKALPSRGQVAVRGALDAHPFETVLEPDGEFGHWLSVEASLRRAAGVEPGQRVEVAVALAGEWPEPSVPPDLAEALSDASREIRELWGAITPMARWEWVRWVNATKNPETRRRRVEVSISKMRSGKRRPCCFNLASCTDPDLAKSGKLVRRQPAAD